MQFFYKMHFEKRNRGINIAHSRVGKLNNVKMPILYELITTASEIPYNGFLKQWNSLAKRYVWYQDYYHRGRTCGKL